MKRIAILSITCITLLSACGEKPKQEEKAKTFVLSDTMKHMIEMDTVTTCNVTSELSLSGIVSFNDNNVVKVYPRSSGQVMETKVSLGDKITKGQVLAIIKSADVAGNYTDLASANADLAISQRQLDNVQSLYKNGISSEKELNEAKQNYEKSLSAKNKIQSLIAINGGGKTNSGGQYLVTAPIDGYIVEKKITAGAFIRPDMGDNLFTISNLKNVWVYANVYEADIAKIKEGFPVRVLPISYPDKVFTGKIDKVSQVLDPQSKAMKVRINIDNKDMTLKPDMFANVIVNNVQSEQTLCIPKAALIPEEGKNYVIIYTSDSDLKIAQVSVLKTVNDKAFITSGVSLGDKVISKNQILIFNQLTGQ